MTGNVNKPVSFGVSENDCNKFFAIFHIQVVACCIENIHQKCFFHLILVITVAGYTYQNQCYLSSEVHYNLIICVLSA